MSANCHQRYTFVCVHVEQWLIVYCCIITSTRSEGVRRRASEAYLGLRVLVATQMSVYHGPRKTSRSKGDWITGVSTLRYQDEISPTYLCPGFPTPSAVKGSVHTTPVSPNRVVIRPSSQSRVHVSRPPSKGLCVHRRKIETCRRRETFYMPFS